MCLRQNQPTSEASLSGQWRSASPTLLIMIAALLAVSSGRATAGVGPENVAVIVNENSQASLQIAAEYVELRKIPDGNVIRLSDVPEFETIDVEVFREKLLGPVLRTIERRGLALQIECVAWSSDFPTAINVKADVGQTELPQVLTPVASLNGMTYLYQLVMNKDLRYLSLQSNGFARRPLNGQVSRGFRQQQQWAADGSPVSQGGLRYLLSTVLAVTRGRGTSTEETVDYLRRSVSADSTFPDGTFYYLRNKNIRSTSRDGLFVSAASLLNAAGLKARIVDGVLPKDVDDVQGLMVGSAKFDWEASGSTILPGAICEHFTSYGGVMREKASQTPLSEFLKHGAAGASGTVTEPYAIAAKFPDAFIHAHYASGCCLAEAFYQSVKGPYQLLIVGDPLCQPWADPPEFRVAGLEPDQKVNGFVTATPLSGDNVSRYEFYVDGRLRDACRPGESRQFDSTALSNGSHEIRVVAVSNNEVEARSRIIIPVEVAN